MDLSVILMEPQTPGNVGAICRVMKNFGFEKLVLVNPECDHLADEARARAMHARDVLKNATVTDSLVGFDYLIGTTAITGGSYNVRTPVSPEQAAEKLASADASTGLVFGREDHGLSNEELKECDFIVTIPSHPDYPTLNLSHAVGILLYELFLETEEAEPETEPISEEEKELLNGIIDDALDKLEFQTEHKKESHHLLWHRVVGKAMLTSNEARALMKLFKKI